MTDQPPEEHGDDLQFDQAEFTEPKQAEGPTCQACRKAITDRYYQVQGVVLCEPCSESVRAHLTGGSVFRRLAKACFFGFFAAIGGFAIYYGVMKLLHAEIGFISILVGIMVGGAVRKGSEGRGGPLYQLVAVIFTYLAICASYAVMFLPEIFNPNNPAAAAGEKAAAVGEEPAAVEKPVEGAEGEADKDVDMAADKPVTPLTPADIVIGLAALAVISLWLPIAGSLENPIGFLIIGFALFQAFRTNQKQKVVITGPHPVGPGPDDLVPVHG